ncbi:MAG: esterase [Lachnospiraceae bacterium]|nr:esterase [Lachnospiraceae bacterium]
MEIYEYGSKSASVVLVQMIDEHEVDEIENEFKLIKDNVDGEFRFIAVKVEDWNYDLAPWEAPPVFGKHGFGDGAGNTLKEVLKLCSDDSMTYIIGGYSLAGLFALWVGYQTDVFKGIAAASPSIWYPTFTDYMRKNELESDIVYLSLGDKEEKTRNQVMATVADKIREAYVLLKEQNVECILEWNSGNHFKDSHVRIAKAFCWVMEGCKG